jgi:hypothetical protein
MAKKMRRCVIAAALFAGIVGCGQEPAGANQKDHPAPGNQLFGNWTSSGTETDPSAAFNAQFGSVVATNGNWIAVTRLPSDDGNPARTEAWVRTSAGWSHAFSRITATDHRAVVAMSPNWLLIGEPCVSSNIGCHGRFFAFFLENGNWFELIRVDVPSNPWDFGSALAIRENPNDTEFLDALVAVGAVGSVQVFDIQTTSFFPIETLTEPSTPYLGSGFGSAVAITSAGIAVSAPGGSRFIFSGKRLMATRSPGFVYVFGPTTTRLTGVGSEGASGGPGFGASLSASVDGKTLAVGAAVEVGRSLTAYVFRLGTSGAFGLTNTIGPPAGATGTDISVAIDGFLGVTTNAAGSATAGTLRIFSFGPAVLGPSLAASFSLDGSVAPIDLRAGQAVVGQPAFLGAAGYVATYAESALVVLSP